MATRVSKEERAAAKPDSAERSAAEELSILHPDRNITISGRRITIHEYGFREGLELRPQYKPFLDALYGAIKPGSESPALDVVEDVFAARRGDVIALIAKATGLEPEWIEGLPDDDGYLLMESWWIVNSGFFIRRMLRRGAAERATKALDAVRSLAGAASTTRSSPPVMEEPQRTSPV